MLPCFCKPVKRLSAVWAAMVLAVVSPAAGSHAASIVLDVEYTRDGAIDDEARGAVQTYLQFLLSRLQHDKPQTVTEYLQDCRSGARPKEPDGSCPLPDPLIQLQIAERQGEVQISGAVGRKAEPGNLRPHNLDSIRVKTRDLTDGLSIVAKSIAPILSATTPTEKVHVIIACFGSGSEQPDARRRGPGPQTRGPGSVTSAVSDYAKRLPRALEALMRDQPRIRVSTNNDAGAECGTLEGLQAIAKAAKAEAVLSGRVFTDDKSGLVVLPHIFLTGANKRIGLPYIHVPRGANAAAYTVVEQKLEPAITALVDSSKRSDIEATSYVLIAQKLGAATNALVGSSKRSELVKAIDDGTELSYYLDRAKEHLSSSPPDYDAADALLELAIAKAPAEQQSYLLQASSLTDRRRYKDAAAALRSGIGQASQVSDRKVLYAALAENFVRAGDQPSARRVYEEALNGKILAEDALLGIAKTHLSARPPERSPELAMEFALKAAAQNPSSPDAYSLAGQIAEAEKDFAKAEEYYQNARKVSPASPEIVSRLSSLYERWATEELRTRRPNLAIEHLSKSIELSPSVRKYYDRAQAYFDPFRKSDGRANDYARASTDYQAAFQIARRERIILAQFPWLMPNLVETLIFEGKFREAKGVAQELFVTLASDPAIRPSADPKEIRLVTAFLNAAAEMLDAGSADKEFYLLENAVLGIKLGRLPWSFAEMVTYLDHDYSTIKSQLDPNEREARIAAVKQWISQLSGRSP